ncbi:helix-turn-helix transcriptional regulator [Microvirga sp. 17 mud 1-3]|uniref:helix-turn-helix transcriptional regulator n=1 Tax=Microvirga sp. 17 mud 1-3 TaxID=2082949 RepID=UPI000D6D62A4|nr:helix-turn-helix transcriptional regulator [Microvirga sp. 17 mud 1-3]AWM85506.1 transcriptional regulator [Microvirga sp. 17 mud 1-3]
MVNAAQVRAARALLNWSQDDLASRANVSTRTLNYLEKGMRHPQKQTLKHIERAFAEAGVEFVATTDGAVGVLLRNNCA